MTTHICMRCGAEHTLATGMLAGLRLRPCCNSPEVMRTTGATFWL